MEDLVSTEWLAGEIGKPDLVVFDATKYLPNEPQDGRKEFAAARIPGARFQRMDGIGHFPFAENPARFLDFLLPALGSLRT